LSFAAPVALLQAPADATRWYVVEKGGVVRVFSNVAAVNTSAVYADISSRVATCGECGLLGLAFHPNFPGDPRVYLSYTATVSGQLVSRLSVFQTSNGGATFLSGSESTLISVDQPEDNHNGGHIVFGPDGFLYWGLGDGGGGGDVHGAIGNGQEATTLLGKILRIDVNAAGTPYGIPAGNPNASNPLCSTGSGSTACPEIHTLGVRNPWKFSFDRETGMLWIADVGQSLWEEVDRVGSSGVNLGWRCREGAHAYNSTCGTATNLTEPLAEYDHTVGQSITGGFVYRGNTYPPLRGSYIFGDFVSGRLFQMSAMAAAGTTQVITAGASTSLGIAAFGESNDHELYVVDYNGGGIYQVQSP
jgi:glucose/arabinose dehydrogenase